MTKTGLIGDNNKSTLAHQNIPPANQLSADASGLRIEAVWIDTEQNNLEALSPFDGIWCAPGSQFYHSK
ncbi:MAG: CTP synthase (UTP-ammonia lyase) [Gammaproteobacteria bacterium]|jgi:CTP synthase (UTP-ammonia lyase)